MSESSTLVTGQLVDLRNRRIFAAEVELSGTTIGAIREVSDAPDRYLLPGFVDAHVHIESSMLPPAEFARIAVRHGTVATVSDPHEIANVLGMDGIEFMLASARRSPFKFSFGAPSCVPATGFETSGAKIGAGDVASLLARPEIGYLSEVMNYPGVLAGDADLLAKIAAAKAVGKRVDGHSPGLRGDDAKRYRDAGIETDHECFTLDEALDKLRCGMRIAIREGSAAKNYEALKTLLRTHPARCMLCTDDMHPNRLVAGHLDRLVARAVRDGADVFEVLRCACLHPVEFYSLPVGLLRPGDPADFVMVRDLVEFDVLGTWIDGRRVAQDGQSLIAHTPDPAPNRFRTEPVGAGDFAIACEAIEKPWIRVIEARNGQLITGQSRVEAKVANGWIVPDPSRDLLKIGVVSRYSAARPSVALISGFGLRRGAIASSVAHDSHNIVTVGTNDADICAAVNLLIGSGGGVCAVADGKHEHLPLAIAGLMATGDGDNVAECYERVAAFARNLGTELSDAFMTLSFMALLVIPDLKLSDRGLFSGSEFRFVPLTVPQK